MEMQLKMFGARSGAEQVEPIKHGDKVLVQWASRPLEHHVVLWVDDNEHGRVFGTVRLTDGNECIVYERELRGRVRS